MTYVDGTCQGAVLIKAYVANRKFCTSVLVINSVHQKREGNSVLLQLHFHQSALDIALSRDTVSMSAKDENEAAALEKSRGNMDIEDGEEEEDSDESDGAVDSARVAELEATVGMAQ